MKLMNYMISLAPKASRKAVTKLWYRQAACYQTKTTRPLHVMKLINFI